MLFEAEIPPPYILVGHSFGGFTARYFATTYSDITVGVVLVDSSHPEQIERLAKLDKQHKDEPLKISRREAPPEWMNKFERQWYLLNASRKATVAQMSELAGFATSAQQVSSLGPMPNIPLAVISRGKIQLPIIDGVELEQQWQLMQKDLLSLTTHSWQEIIKDSGHQVYTDAPDVIIENILKVVEMSRKNMMNSYSYNNLIYSGENNTIRLRNFF